MTEILTNKTEIILDEAQVNRLQAVEGILALSHSEITDPDLHDLLLQNLTGAITTEEALELGRRLVQGE